MDKESEEGKRAKDVRRAKLQATPLSRFSPPDRAIPMPHDDRPFVIRWIPGFQIMSVPEAVLRAQRRRGEKKVWKTDEEDSYEAMQERSGREYSSMHSLGRSRHVMLSHPGQGRHRPRNWLNEREGGSLFALLAFFFHAD